MNKFQVTRRQAILLFLICTISSKTQMLPCLLAADVGSSLWLALLLGSAIDLVFLTLTITINRLCPNLTIHQMLKQTFGKFIASLVVILFLIYFIFIAVLPYEAVREVFSNNLFDNISWQLFSLFLLFAVGYLAYSGSRTIGRSAEFYFYIIISCVALLVLMGLFTAPLSNILPLGKVSFAEIFKTDIKHSIWFADYMIFYVLMGRIKPGETGLKYTDLLYFISIIIFYAISYISLYSLYTVQTPSQTSLLSSISSFSMLGLDIGRVDWFLVLLAQISSVISCSTYIYCASDCLNQLTRQKNYRICVLASLVFLYILDLSLFTNVDVGLSLFIRFSGIIAASLQIIAPLLVFIAAIVCKKRSKNKNKEKLC